MVKMTKNIAFNLVKDYAMIELLGGRIKMARSVSGTLSNITGNIRARLLGGNEVYGDFINLVFEEDKDLLKDCLRFSKESFSCVMKDHRADHFRDNEVLRMIELDNIRELLELEKEMEKKYKFTSIEELEDYCDIAGLSFSTRVILADKYGMLDKLTPKMMSIDAVYFSGTFSDKYGVKGKYVPSSPANRVARDVGISYNTLLPLNASSVSSLTQNLIGDINLVADSMFTTEDLKERSESMQKSKQWNFYDHMVTIQVMKDLDYEIFPKISTKYYREKMNSLSIIELIKIYKDDEVKLNKIIELYGETYSLYLTNLEEYINSEQPEGSEEISMLDKVFMEYFSMTESGALLLERVLLKEEEIPLEVTKKLLSKLNEDERVLSAPEVHIDLLKLLGFSIVPKVALSYLLKFSKLDQMLNYSTYEVIKELQESPFYDPVILERKESESRFFHILEKISEANVLMYKEKERYGGVNHPDYETHEELVQSREPASLANDSSVMPILATIWNSHGVYPISKTREIGTTPTTLYAQSTDSPFSRHPRGEGLEGDLLEEIKEKLGKYMELNFTENNFLVRWAFAYYNELDKSEGSVPIRITDKPYLSQKLKKEFKR